MNRDARSLSDMLADRRVSHVDAIPSGGIAIHFIDGTRLTISPEPAGFTVTFHEAVRGPRRPGDPSPRQRQYLEFIVRYMARCGFAPAESDIQEHFQSFSAVGARDDQDAGTSRFHRARPRLQRPSAPAFDSRSDRPDVACPGRVVARRSLASAAPPSSAVLPSHHSPAPRLP